MTVAFNQPIQTVTYMHIDNLPITFIPTNRRRHNDQRILIHEIPYTSLILCAVAMLCDEVEFEGEGKREEEGEDEQV